MADFVELKKSVTTEVVVANHLVYLTMFYNGVDDLVLQYYAYYSSQRLCKEDEIPIPDNNVKKDLVFSDGNTALIVIFEGDDNVKYSVVPHEEAADLVDGPDTTTDDVVDGNVTDGILMINYNSQEFLGIREPDYRLPFKLLYFL